MTANLALGLDQPASPDAASLSAFLAGGFGPSTLAVLHYGSRAQNREPRADSAFDFFVIVSHYKPAYESLAASVGTSYSPGVATALARVLAPNVIAVTQRDTDYRAKVCVLSLRDLQRACSPHPRDHFTQGRLLQFVLLTWSRDEAAAQAVRDAVAGARARTFVWGRPSLPERFNAETFAYAILNRSLAGEIRPETGDHARTLVTAQIDTLRAIYAPLLADLAARGDLIPVGPAGDSGQSYRLATPVTRLESLRLTLYFHKSKVRNTVRLLKHVVLYEGWLDYIIRKIDRSSGEQMVLTERERRWPLIFLWPRFFHYLRTRPQRRQ
jgi:hypothetical protein